MAHVLIMFHGKAGAGKTTNTKMLDSYLNSRGYAVKYVKFATPVYELHDLIQNYMLPFGYKPEVKNRRLLQIVGTELGRGVYGNNVWADAAMTSAKQFLDLWRPEEPVAVIMDDLRFPEEFHASDTLKKAGVEVIRITLQAPEALRKQRTDKWPEDPKHASETSLDQYFLDGKFDLAVHTVNSAEDDFEVVKRYVDSRLPREREIQHIFEDVVGRFNAELEKLSLGSKLGANFKWVYTESGVKQLRVTDVADIVYLPPEEIEKAKREVPSLIEQAGDLIAEPE